MTRVAVRPLAQGFKVIRVRDERTKLIARGISLRPATVFDLIADGHARPNDSSTEAKAANTAAFAEGIASGKRVYVPAGIYYTSDAIHVDNTCWIEGDGGLGVVNGVADVSTRIIPPLGKCGFIIHRPTTSQSGGRGDGSVIQGIGVTNDVTPLWTSGVKTLGAVVCSTAANLAARGVVFICTTAGTSGGSEPAWNTTISATTVDGSVTWTAARASGFMLFARARLVACSAHQMGGHGIEIAANSAGEPAANANNWCIDHFVSMLNRADGAYVDGTDANAGIATMLDSSSNGRHGVYDSSQIGNTWAALHTASNGGAWFKADDPAALGLTLINPYSEGGQVAASFTSNRSATIIGGVFGTGLDSSSRVRSVGATDSVIRVANGTGLAQLIGDYTTDLIHQVLPAGGVTALMFRYGTPGGGWYGWSENNVDVRTPLAISGNQALTGVDPGLLWLARPTLLGASGTRRKIWADAAQPSTDTWAVGDIVINNGSDPTIVGWKCTVAGTPGTWAAITAGSAVLAANLTLAVTDAGVDNNPARPSVAAGGNLTAYPFATLSAALAAIPRNLNAKTATINDSRTASEGVFTGGYVNGTLTISGCKLLASEFRDCGLLKILSATITGPITLERCDSEVTGTTSGIGRVLVKRGQARVEITASAGAASVLKADHASYIGYSVVSTTATATPVEFTNVAYSEIVGAGLSGSNPSAAFGITIAGGGKHVLTGASITGAANLSLDGYTVTWAALSAENHHNAGTFAYWADNLWVNVGKFRIFNNSSQDYDDLVTRDLQFGRFFKQYGLNRPLDPAYTEVTAYAGGGQANAVKVGRQLTLITTVASAGDSVRLFDDSDEAGAGGGTRGEILNGGANSANVYPKSGRKIFLAGVDQGLNNPIALAAGKRAIWTMKNDQNVFVTVV
jgi:hypothetical protein